MTAADEHAEDDGEGVAVTAGDGRAGREAGGLAEAVGKIPHAVIHVIAAHASDNTLRDTVRVPIM